MAILAYLVPVLFWWLLLTARDDIGWKGVVFIAVIWSGLLAVALGSLAPPYVFSVGQIVLTIVLLTMRLGGDVHIR